MGTLRCPACFSVRRNSAGKCVSYVHKALVTFPDIQRVLGGAHESMPGRAFARDIYLQSLWRTSIYYTTESWLRALDEKQVLVGEVIPTELLETTLIVFKRKSLGYGTKNPLYY